MTSNFLSSHEKVKIWLKCVALFIWKWRICQYYFFSISFRHKTEHMGPLWYVLRVIPTYLVNLICQKRKLFRQILVIWVKIIYIFSMFSFALRPVWSEKNAYRFFINVSLFWIMQKTCLWNYAFFHEILDIIIFVLASFVYAMIFEFMVSQRFGTMVFTSAKLARKLFSFMNQTNVLSQLVIPTEAHSTLFTFVFFYAWMSRWKKKNWYNIVIPIFKFKIFLLFLTLVGT